MTRKFLEARIHKLEEAVKVSEIDKGKLREQLLKNLQNQIWNLENKA